MQNKTNQVKKVVSPVLNRVSNEQFLSQTEASGFEGLSDTPLPKLPLSALSPRKNDTRRQIQSWI